MRAGTVLAVLLAAGAVGLGGCAQFDAAGDAPRHPLSLTSLLLGAPADESQETIAETTSPPPAAPAPVPPLPPAPSGVQVASSAVPTKEELLATLKARPDVDPAELARWERIVQTTPEVDWPVVALQLQAVLNYKEFQAKQAPGTGGQESGVRNQESGVRGQESEASKGEAQEAAESNAKPKRPEAKMPEEAPADEVAADSEIGASPGVLPPPSEEKPPRPVEVASASEKALPGQSPPPGQWRLHLEQAIEALEAELTAAVPDEPAAVGEDANEEDSFSPSERKRALEEAHLRLLYLAAKRQSDAARGVEQLPPAEREFWKHQVHGLGVFLDEQGAPVADRRARLALRELREGLHHLAAASGLDVRNLAFCPQVYGFGNFVEFSPYEFRAGQEVLLYAEIDNFTVESRPDGFETELQGSYQIFDAAGRRVAEHVFPPEKELCRNRRRDYFVPYRVYLPKRIAPGQYTLQLTVEDLKGQKFGQAPIRFTIVP
ncbi:MAG: hypothetical protein KY475_08445 [Planctomycetes bacterium]|nr:hypothetical protein [Planctomycetota bacterium]